MQRLNNRMGVMLSVKLVKGRKKGRNFDHDSLSGPITHLLFAQPAGISLLDPLTLA